MTFFPKSGRVYVLGAGASVFAGYPLAAGLLHFIRSFRTSDRISAEIASRVVEKLGTAEFQFARKVIKNPNGTANLEELLTYLELYRSFPLTNFDTNPWTDRDSADIRRVVADGFLNYQRDLRAVMSHSKPVQAVIVDGDRVSRIARSWARKLRPGDVVVTFNWDIFHEVAFWEAELWSYRDGYGFECGEQGHKEERTKILVLKLHGSVNWVQREASEPVAELANVPDFFRGSKDYDWRGHVDQAQVDSGRKLVLPTYLKDISSNRVLLDLWTQAHQHLVEAKELIVIGYSLNPVDHPARLLFGMALSRNKALKSVTVISPQHTEWDDFLYGQGKGANYIRLCFEDWVTKD